MQICIPTTMLQLLLATLANPDPFELGERVPHARPVLRYKLCHDVIHEDCKPTDFGSDSTFKFGDITSGTVFYRRTSNRPSLLVFCSSTEPLRWQLLVFTVESSSNILRFPIMNHSYGDGDRPVCSESGAVSGGPSVENGVSAIWKLH